MTLIRWWPLGFSICSAAFTSRSVFLLNAADGGWALLLSLLTVVLAMCSKSSALVLRWMMVVALGCTLLFHLHCRSLALDTATCSVETPYRTALMGTKARYVDGSVPLNNLQWYDINTLMDIHDTSGMATVARVHDADTIHQRTSLSDLLRSRQPEDTSAMHWLLVGLLGTALANFILVLIAYSTQRPFNWDVLRSRSGLFLFVAFGSLVGSIKAPPSTWLSNNFLTRGDDWHRYIASSQDVLAGNWALIPIPGGVEMWGLGIVYFFAAVQFILGPALLLLSITLHGAHYGIVWALFALPDRKDKWAAVLLAFAALLYVEVDLNSRYAWSFLSDTLPLVLFAVLFVGVIRGHPLKWLGIGTALLLLLRADYIAIAPLLAVCLLMGNRSKQKEWLALLLPIMVVLALYLIRRSLAYPSTVPFTPNGHPWEAVLSVQHFGPKLWVILGRYDLLHPSFHHRYHWWVVHVLFVASAVYYFVRVPRDRIVLFLLGSWLWFLVTRLTSPAIGIYGYRHSLVLVLVEMLFIAWIFVRHWRRIPNPALDHPGTHGLPKSITALYPR